MFNKSAIAFFMLLLVSSLFLPACSSTVVSNQYSLEQNYPNPFYPSTTIKFSIPEKTEVNLKIVNVMGKDIKTLAQKEMEPGTYTFSWNGEDEKGETVPDGVYMYNLKAGGFNQTKKMILTSQAK